MKTVGQLMSRLATCNPDALIYLEIDGWDMPISAVDILPYTVTIVAGGRIIVLAEDEHDA